MFLCRAAVKIPNPEVEIRANCYQLLYELAHSVSMLTFSRNALSSAILWPKVAAEIPSKTRKRFEMNGDNASLSCFIVIIV